jgi:hypothetical protein
MEGDLSSFVDHAAGVVAGSPALSQRTTDLRITVPLLDTLGWDVHGADVVGEYAVAGDDGAVTVDFALLLEGEPAAFLVTAGLDEGVGPEHGERLEAAMAAAGVEYGLVAAGDTFAFVAGGPEDPERVRCSLSELPERGSVLAHYTRAAARRRRDRRRGEAREAAAAALADRRSAVGAAVGEALAADVPDPVGTELEATGAAVVDAVRDALAAGRHPSEGVDGGDAGTPAVDPPVPTPADPDAESAAGTPESDAPGGGNGSESGSEATPPGSAANGSAEDPADDEPGVSRSDDAEEYAVRFFDGSNSVGAVGHGTAPGALVQAVEYLIDTRGVEGNVSLPWGPSEDRAVLNHDPVHPDGTEMVDAAELSNGHYVCTTIGSEGIREAVGELAESTGLRVMFQGDW